MGAQELAGMSIIRVEDVKAPMVAVAALQIYLVMEMMEIVVLVVIASQTERSLVVQAEVMQQAVLHLKLGQFEGGSGPFGHFFFPGPNGGTNNYVNGGLTHQMIHSIDELATGPSGGYGHEGMAAQGINGGGGSNYRGRWRLAWWRWRLRGNSLPKVVLAQMAA